MGCQASHSTYSHVSCCVLSQGLAPLPGGAEGETHTNGMENLAASCAEFASAGARFAKWRATLKIGEGTPTESAVQVNAEQLAMYARICQVSHALQLWSHTQRPLQRPQYLVILCKLFTWKS